MSSSPQANFRMDGEVQTDLPKIMKQFNLNQSEAIRLAIRLCARDIHSGFRNYETWNVLTWLSNDIKTHNLASERIDAAMIGPLNKYQTPEEAAIDAIQELVAELNPIGDDKASMFTDILGAALQEVDWTVVVQQITQHNL